MTTEDIKKQLKILKNHAEKVDGYLGKMRFRKLKKVSRYESRRQLHRHKKVLFYDAHSNGDYLSAEVLLFYRLKHYGMIKSQINYRQRKTLLDSAERTSYK